jgi:hypothetical protein
MKWNIIVLCTALFILFVAGKKNIGGIHGTIKPADGAAKVWAIRGKDTVSTVPISGNFNLELNSGNWELLIQANKGYKNTTVNNLLVENSRYTDAGEIVLLAE